MGRKVSGIVWDGSELRQLMREHPDYKICVLASDEANSGDYSWMYCSDIRCGIGEILDCSNPVDDEYMFTDRDYFEERLEEFLWDNMCGEDLEPTEEEVKERLTQELAKYEPFWTKVIKIYADN